MKNHLEPEYKIHTLEFGELNPLHIDTSLILIGPGRVIVNPAKPCRQVSWANSKLRNRTI